MKSQISFVESSAYLLHSGKNPDKNVHLYLTFPIQQ